MWRGMLENQAGGLGDGAQGGEGWPQLSEAGIQHFEITHIILYI
jgi:hypothetical protein